MALSSRADNVLLLLYAPGSNSQLHHPIDGIYRLHHLVRLLQNDGVFWLPRSRALRYEYRPVEFGFFSSGFYDDLFSLYSLGCLQLEKSSEPVSDHSARELRMYYRQLTHGEQIYADFEHVAECTVTLSQSLGVRLGGLLYNSLSSEDKNYLHAFQQRTEDLDPDVLCQMEKL